jgi:hypothetical protein
MKRYSCRTPVVVYLIALVVLAAPVETARRRSVDPN